MGAEGKDNTHYPDDELTVDTPERIPMPADMFYGASPIIFDRAKQLRAQLTPAESCLWNALSANKLAGFRFKVQHPLNNFIADFYCHAAKLIIELDGSIHDNAEQKGWDDNRTAMLEEFGIKVIRFRNDDVLTNIDGVLANIKQHLSDYQPNPLTL